MSAKKINSYEQQGKYKTDRLKGLSDGLFAIVMTILVLEITFTALDSSSETVLNLFIQIWPQIFNYLISFFAIGLIWLYHNITFTYIKKINLRMLSYNIFLLFFVSLLPFTSSLAAKYLGEWPAAMFFGFNLIMLIGMNVLIFAYASKKSFFKSDLNPNYIKREKQWGKIVFIVGILLISLSLFNPIVSLAIYSFFIIIYWFIAWNNREGIGASPTHLNVEKDKPSFYLIICISTAILSTTLLLYVYITRFKIESIPWFKIVRINELTINIHNIIIYFLSFIFGLVSIIFGSIDLVRIKDGDRKIGRSIDIFGIISSSIVIMFISIAIFVFIWVITGRTESGFIFSISIHFLKLFS